MRRSIITAREINEDTNMNKTKNTFYKWTEQEIDYMTVRGCVT